MTVDKNVTILTNSAIGELLLALPLVQECRKVYPSATITLVCSRAAVAGFARQLAVANEVILLPRQARRSPISLMKSRNMMKKANADILFQTFTSHGTFGNILAGASEAKVRCGFSNGRFQNLLTHRIPVDPASHRITSNLNLLRRLGHSGIVEPAGRYLPFIEQTSQLFRAGKVGSRYGIYAVISIGSDPSLAFKRWPMNNWTQLCKMLQLDGIKPVFVGDESLRTDINAVIDATGVACVNLAGETEFADLAALIQSSALVIGTDGMILHFAAAMYKASVGIFGPTSPCVVGPWGHIHQNISLDLPCSPCYGAYTIGKGAGCATRECLNLLSVSLVYKAVRNILEQSVNVRNFDLDRLAATGDK